jgi:formylglycine-generating enzyme required for sulfatase activity
MRAAVVSVVFALVWGVWTVAVAEPTVTIYTDRNDYQSGDTVLVSLAAENHDVGMSVSVCVGLITPDGLLYTLSPFGTNGWTQAVEAWVPEIYVPSPFDMGATPFFAFDLPCNNPPMVDLGCYNLASVLTRAGTFDWVCDASFAPFEITDSGPSSEITMVSIHAGSFLMGSPENEEGRYPSEGPQRTVNISEFRMSETEVTQKQWEEVMSWNDSFFNGDYYPVEQVTWFDCVSFCNALSDADGYTKCYTITNTWYSGNHIISAEVSCDFNADGYRLPTEAEWEYACRAGTTTRFCTGDSDSDLERAGWYLGHSGSTTHPVGQKERNAWGLYDIHGNVWERCWDWYDEDYYGTRPDPDLDPTGAPTGASSGSRRVIRGGSLLNEARYCRSAYRSCHSLDSQIKCLGFRIARSAN